MRRFVITAMLLLSWAADSYAAGDVIREFSSKLASSCAVFDYSFSVKTTATVTGNGSVTYMDGRYKMLGNGLEVWSNGIERWTVDHATKEVYIESLEDAGTDYLANPAILLQAIGTVFTQSGEKAATYKGKSVTQVTLIPSVHGTGLKSVVLYFTSDITPVGALVVADDGTSASVTINSFKFSRPVSESFSFDVSKLGKSYLITDLR